MKRNINISTGPTDPSKNIVNIKDLSGLVNHSVDLIFCDVLENISSENLNSFAVNLLKKIRPEGYIVFQFLDVKKICSEFLNSRIDNQKFVGYFKNKTNLLSLDIFYTLFDTKEFSVTKLEQIENKISITLHRTSL